MNLNASPYGWLMLVALAISVAFWARLARRDDRLIFVYLGALVGAFVGAKVAYLLAEGWKDFGKPDVWLRLATGKSVLGALPGGYLGVEWVKRLVGYRQVTGDWFAAIAPAGIVVGRIGCWLHGCCLGQACGPGWFAVRDGAGIDRWPAVPVEISFNLLLLAAFLVCRRRGWLPGQHFHVYLIAYGAFRFAHEFVRDTPRLLGPLSGYHFIAAGVMVLGLVAFQCRQRQAPCPAGQV
jgi:phosphatidylglycerol:prolipoprotein diacylglycerol transferase